MLLLLIVATIGSSILTTNILVNSAMARGAHGVPFHRTPLRPYGAAHGVGYGGVGPVFQEPVNSGNSNQDKQINKFYHCISKTHEAPPNIEKVDNCYYQALGGSTGR